MEVLVQEGKVSYCGSSNFAGWQIAVAQGEAKARHFMGLVSEQSIYNLTNRNIELGGFSRSWRTNYCELFHLGRQLSRIS